MSDEFYIAHNDQTDGPNAYERRAAEMSIHSERFVVIVDARGRRMERRGSPCRQPAELITVCAATFAIRRCRQDDDQYTCGKFDIYIVRDCRVYCRT